MAETPKKPYRRRTAKPAPVRFEVETPDGTVEITAEHRDYHELAGLEDDLIGEWTEGADPTGAKYLRERVLKLGRVTSAVATGSPEGDEEARQYAGRWAAYYGLAGNENLAWLGWPAYLRALEGTTPKSDAAGGGARDGEGGGAAGGDGAPDARVRAV